MKKTSLLIVTTLCLGLYSCKKQDGSGVSEKVNLSTEDEKTFYAVGAMFGQRLGNFGLSENETNAVLAGMRDSIQGKEKQVDVAEYQGKIQELFRARMTQSSEKEKQGGVKFLEDFVSKEGATKTESGLAYKIIKPGSDKKPKASDVVKVHYHGTLTDGTVFDSSVERGKEVSFPLDRVIKGWTEGLQLIGEGGKIKLVIPADLAYGDHGAPPKIPGGATLVFEVELFDIVDKDAPKEEKTAPAPKKEAGKKK